MRRWKRNTSKDQQVVVYSNRPPKEMKGGAVKVIGDLPVKVWVGPGDPVPDAQWRQMTDAERLRDETVLYKGKQIRIYTFAVPQSLWDAQYNKIANSLIWPIFHSADATAFQNPEALCDYKNHQRSYDYSYPGDPEEDYERYKAFNALGNDVLTQLKKKNVIHKKDLQWVHDYQCANVPGNIFTLHIPFPSLDYLQQVKINGKPLMGCHFFQDFIQKMADHSLITFQRPVDMKNFIEVAAVMDEKFGMVARGGLMQRTFGIGDSATVRIFNKEVKLLNIPVSVNKEETLREAQENRLNCSTFDAKRLEEMGITYPSETVSNGRVPLQAALGSLLHTKEKYPEEEHRIFLAMHRNDYSKGTLEKLIAAEEYMECHSEEKGKTHFLFFLQPTRPTVPGYEAYRDVVERKAKALREKWGNSITVIPEGLEFEDYMGLLRHLNVVAILGTAPKDGHDLTLREAACARADYPAGDQCAALAIVTTDGTGASDILRGSEGKLGAFVIDKAENFGQMVEKLKETFEKITALTKTDEGRHTLAERYQVAARASEYHSPQHFKDGILSAAMRQRNPRAA